MKKVLLLTTMFVAIATRTYNIRRSHITLRVGGATMKAARSVSDYVATTFLIGLLTAVGVSAAITVVLALWPPMAYLAGKFF